MSSARPLALITGASSGLGAVFAARLAARGYDVALVARRRERLMALATDLERDYGCNTMVIPCDLSQLDAHVLILAALKSRLVALLVNNAGYSINALYDGTDWPTQRDSVMTLVMAVCSLTHALLPGMRAQKAGRIITISSILALSQGGRGHTLYPASKAFVHKFMLSLNAEVRGDGIICTSVLPGSTRTAFSSANGAADALNKMPAFLLQTAEQVVDAALKGNDRGRLIVIPGWHNKATALLLKLLPDCLVRWGTLRFAPHTLKGDAL